MFKLLLSLLLISVFASARAEICLICNCTFVNVSPVAPSPEESSEIITFKYEADSIEPYNVNATYDAVQKYFYVDCSSENNVGQITNLEWPKLRVLGVFANFRSSKWKKLESFPMNVRKQMTVLSLCDNLIQDIENFELDDFGNLKMLNLSRNQLEVIKKATFSKSKLLRILDLSNNWIKQIEDWAFFGINLEYLNLSRNSIAHLTPDVFRGLNNLKVLDLTENNMHKLPEFGNILPSLLVLLLRSNGFQQLGELPRELKKLDLDFNQLTELRLSHPHLEILSINNNELLSLSDITFPYLRVLRASRNNLTKLTDLKNNHIEILDLSFNKFKVIPETIVSHKLPFLKELYLDGNPIGNFTFPKQDEPFSHLKVLSLTRLKSFKKILRNTLSGVFPRETRLCTNESDISLNFSHNSIKYIDKDVFQNISVCAIDLSNNQLRTLSESLLPWRKLSYINLQQNPWQCDCNIQWMLDDFLVFMYENHPTLLFDLRCSTPQRYNNRMFVYWYNKSNHVFCNSGPSSFYLDLIGGKKVEIWTVSAITCVVLGCLIVITTIIILVLVCTKPKKSNKSGRVKKNKGPPYYKQISSNTEEKANAYSDKCV